MRKKRLSILLALIMVVTLLPMNTEKVSAMQAVAQIGTQLYGTLQDAVDAVTAGTVSGSIITLLGNTGAGPSGVTISGNKNFTIDLNGYTLDGGTVCAIQKDGSGTLTITGGVVTSQVSSSGTITVVGGSVIVLGGTVQNTGDNGYAIFINWAGSVSVAGGTIQATGNHGRAILNSSSTTSRVTLTGGTVKAVNNDSYAIVGAFSIPSGTVEIMGSFQASDSKPILSSYSDVQIKANNTTASESGAIGINSTALDGSGICNYKYLKFTSAKITTQLVFNSTTESQDCTNTSMHAAHIHADGRKCWAWNKDTATLTLDGIDLDVSTAESAIRIAVSNAKLILKGNNTITLKDSSVAFPSTISVVYYGLEISGNGSLAINGSNKTGGTSRTVSSGIYTNQKLKITGGTITVSGGAVSTTGNANGVGSESYGLWGYGGVEITGGTVNAYGGSVTFDTGSYGRSNGISRGTGGISLSGGTVTAQAMSGYSPFYSEPTLTGMLLKAGTGTWNNTTGTACTYEPAPPFTAVTDITMTNPDSVQVNTDLTLTGTAAPSSATNKTIVWSVQNANGTGATISGNTFRATTAGAATIKATVVSGSSISSDYTKNFTITVTAPPMPPFTAVADIAMTNADAVQVNTDLTLTGTVTPSSATNKTIVWSVQDANGTGATVNAGTFRATATGTAIIKASVVSGSSISSDYTKNFTITVTTTEPPFAAVADIIMSNATSVQTNTDLTLAGTVTPSSATNKTIVWSVQAANGTGATVSAGTFRATAAGTATIKATVVSGSSISSDYTKNFTITVTTTEPPFAAVADIIMTNATSVQTNTDLTLAGTVTPSSATNKTIVWSVPDANGTGATVSAGTFRATAAGTATIRATVTNGSGVSSNYTKNFTITITAPPTPDNGNSSNSGTTAPVKKEGKIEKDQKLDEKAPIASLKDSTEELKAKVLSAVEQEQLAAGKDVKVILKVEDISASVSAEDKKQIEEKLTAEQKASANIALLYIDISLFKKVGDGEETRVAETNGKIEISIEVPESMWSTEAGVDRTYRVIRVHNGVAAVLEGAYDPTTHLFTFETDRFSTYALTYQDGNATPKEDNKGTSNQLTVIQDFNHLRLSAEATKTSQKLTYAKVSEANGYLIYGAKCGQELKKLADVEKTVTSYTAKKLKQGTYYKYQVMAYQMIDGKQVVIRISKVIHSATEGKTYDNPTKVTVDSTSVKLAVEESKTLTCQVILPEGKKLKQHTATIRYESSNKKVATVNNKGKITAKAKGNCYIYAYAQNGVYKKIKVIVE